MNYAFCARRRRFQEIRMPVMTPSSSLADELSSGHVLMMQCSASALRILDQVGTGATAQFDLRAGDEAIRMAGLSARLMRYHTTGVLLLRRLPLPAQPGASAPAPRPTSGAKADAAPAVRKLHADPGARRGRLKNGNRTGDYLKSPRCSARTRAGGCCRQPAMANGRCRMHGGLSTGPRTPEGLARCRTTRLVHGYRTRAHLALRSRAVHAARRLRSLTAGLPAHAAGHGVRRSEIRSQKSEAGTQRPDVRRVGQRLAAGSPAGHGVRRSIRDSLRSSASITPAPPMRNFVLQSVAGLR
jgi:hypothetical protein